MGTEEGVCEEAATFTAESSRSNGQTAPSLPTEKRMLIGEIFLGLESSLLNAQASGGLLFSFRLSPCHLPVKPSEGRSPAVALLTTP